MFFVRRIRANNFKNINFIRNNFRQDINLEYLF